MIKTDAGPSVKSALPLDFCLAQHHLLARIQVSFITWTCQIIFTVSDFANIERFSKFSKYPVLRGSPWSPVSYPLDDTFYWISPPFDRKDSASLHFAPTFTYLRKWETPTQLILKNISFISSDIIASLSQSSSDPLQTWFSPTSGKQKAENNVILNNQSKHLLLLSHKTARTK